MLEATSTTVAVDQLLAGLGGIPGRGRVTVAIVLTVQVGLEGAGDRGRVGVQGGGTGAGELINGAALAWCDAGVSREGGAAGGDAQALLGPDAGPDTIRETLIEAVWGTDTRGPLAG